MSNQERNVEQLHIHIEGLQATLTKRNARIADLEAEVAAIRKNPAASAAEKKAYKQGWKDCAGHLMEATRRHALELAKVRKEAFDLYLKGRQTR
jgi:predicted RNase H-like nuclease (RuvC/YqgF family)